MPAAFPGREHRKDAVFSETRPEQTDPLDGITFRVETAVRIDGDAPGGVARVGFEPFQRLPVAYPFDIAVFIGDVGQAVDDVPVISGDDRVPIGFLLSPAHI